MTLTIFALPAEVLSEIFTQYHNPAIWETCKAFATVAFSTTSLWTTVFVGPQQLTIDGPLILRKRIARTRGRLLDVRIMLFTKNNLKVSAMCKVLSEFNAQIQRFELSTHITMTAGAIVYNVFPKCKVISALEAFSVLSDDESLAMTPSFWPRLDLILVNASIMFPNLRKLHMNSFHGTLPILPSSPSFSQLTTLILDGAYERYNSDPSVIAALLHCTPQLESLWMKHHYWDNPNMNQWRPISGRSISSQNIQLPKLKHLAVSVPGTAFCLIGYIAAPVLEDLHLDASRGETDRDDRTGLDVEWDDREMELAYKTLKLFAMQCRNVRRIAITEVCLSESSWEWLLLGEHGGIPFPKLECIALRRALFFYLPWTWNPFDNGLMKKFARNPKIPLKKLSLLDCTVSLSVSALVDVFRASGARELEYDEELPHWKGGEKEQFDELGVSLTRWNKSQLPDYDWWTFGHQVDATDSEAYTIRRAM